MTGGASPVDRLSKQSTAIYARPAMPRSLLNSTGRYESRRARFTTESFVQTPSSPRGGVSRGSPRDNRSSTASWQPMGSPRFSSQTVDWHEYANKTREYVRAISPRLPEARPQAPADRVPTFYFSSDLGSLLRASGLQARSGWPDPGAPSTPLDAPSPRAHPTPIADTKKMTSMASDALNARFKDMFKAFQFVDLDRSGTLDRQEIKRALELWGLGAGLDDSTLDALFRQCDPNGDGSVSYTEFVDALARDTVTLAAMNKRGLQAKEAMGADDLEAEREFLNLNTGPKGRSAVDARNTSYAFKIVGESIPAPPRAPPPGTPRPGTPRRGGGAGMAGSIVASPRAHPPGTPRPGTPRRGGEVVGISTPRRYEAGGDAGTPRRLPPL